MTDKIVYFTTRRTTVSRKCGSASPKGMVELYPGDNGMTGIDACVPADVAARMLLVAERAGIKIR